MGDYKMSKEQIIHIENRRIYLNIEDIESGESQALKKNENKKKMAKGKEIKKRSYSLMLRMSLRTRTRHYKGLYFFIP